MADLITISSSVLPDAARVVGFRGVEAISRPYEIEIFISLQQELGDELDLADGIGAKAALSIDRQVIGEKPFVFAGILANLELLHAFDGRILLRATLVPRLWALGLSRHSRIFTKMKVPDIIKSVLEENGVVDIDMRLGSYEVEEHVSQYRESDLDFISRWMEREGIFYFFEHTDEGEKLVLCDQKLYDEDELGKPVRYFPQLGHDHSAGQSLRMFTCRHTTLPASVRLKDYDYGKPNLNVSGTARVADNGTGEVSLYGERFFTPAAGDKLARTRAEEMLSRQVVYRATGTRHHLRPGYTFELEEHPMPSFNASYLTIEARHSGNQSAGLAHFRELTGIEHDEVYQVEIEAIPAKVQFRAESRTAWPRIYGFENGVVDGPGDSEYAQIDEHGRYLCKFKYDESKLKNGKATTYVRMMQPHGGDIEGFHFPLRKGTEVVFSFLGGDCDRPVISGVVPNTVNPSPVTSANHTRNVIQTGARNRLEIEDKAGGEWIRLSTPYSNTFLNMGLAWPQHELNLSTTGNAAITAMQAFDIGVGNAEAAPSGAGNMTVHVLNNLTTTIDNVDLKTTVTSGNAYFNVDSGTFTETIKGETYRHVTTGNLKTDVDTGQMLTKVKGDTTLTTDGNYTVAVTAKNTLIDTQTGTTDIKSKGKLTLHTDADCAVEVKSNMTISVDGGVTKEIKGAEEVKTYGPFKKFFASNNVNITGGVKSYTFLGLSNSNTIGATVSTFVGGKVTLDASGAFSATYAYKFDIAGGVAMAFKFGAALTINSAVELTVKPTTIETGAAKISQLPTRLAMTALRYHLSGVHVLS